MRIALAADHRFTADADAAVAEVLRRDLAAVAVCCRRQLRGGTLRLGGSFALGEGVAFADGERVVVLSDLDLFLVIPGGPLRALATAAWLRRRLMGAAAVRLDLTVLARGLIRAGLQDLGPLPRVAGDPRGQTGGFNRGFPLHALHALQAELLDVAPCGCGADLRGRYGVNRCALAALRALRAIEEPAARSLRGAVAWAEAGGVPGLPARARALVAEACDENLALALARRSLASGGWPRWCAARDLLDALRVRLGARISPADRFKACPRLGWTSARRGLRPRLVGDVHPRLAALRHDLLHARGEDGEIDGDRVAHAVGDLVALGLLAGASPGDPEAAWRSAVAAARLDNPLRVVVDP